MKKELNLKPTTVKAALEDILNYTPEYKPSFRAQLVFKRSYCRPYLNDFEKKKDVVLRVLRHQKWLWERALGKELNNSQIIELVEMGKLIMEGKAGVSGRTLWLGGTDLSKLIEATQFNCAFTQLNTVYDAVDLFWLLLQGCGVGFKPEVGTLTGFKRHINEIEVVRSTRKDKGYEDNVETFNKKTGVWTIKVGDSAKAWAKSIGKLLVHRYPAKKLVLDFSEVRPAGERLKGYGWICSGDVSIAKAFEHIAQILNKRSGELLKKIDILDICNWLGTTLSSRRSAEISIMDFGDEEWYSFATAKEGMYEKGNSHREQSNNSLLFHDKPTRDTLEDIFNLMVRSGGSEPAFLNAKHARERAEWAAGFNPCGEVILPNKGFCNLVDVNVSRFIGDSAGLKRAIEIMSRANYRQTCVNLDDGILQEAWNLNNDHLRLCGVGLTGIAMRDDLSCYELESLQRHATYHAYKMADELGTPYPKNVTTVKPSGTQAKCMDTTEGVHLPLGRYIINNIKYSIHDEMLVALKESGYEVSSLPNEPESVIVAVPIEYDNINFTNVDGMEINIESAITQLERYKKYMRYWCQQNVSVTVSYDASEVQDIVDWFIDNWDFYIGVSFIFRNDPTKTARDLGYSYLPQEVVTKERYESYKAKLKPFDIDNYGGDILDDDECKTGVCPIR